MLPLLERRSPLRSLVRASSSLGTSGRPKSEGSRTPFSAERLTEWLEPDFRRGNRSPKHELFTFDAPGRHHVEAPSIKMLFSISLTAWCVFLWVDSRLVVRRLPLIPFGDAVLGFKSEGGWLSWNEFCLRSLENPEAAVFSVPYWALVSLGLAFSWRAIAPERDRRVHEEGWDRDRCDHRVFAVLQGYSDPVAELLQAISTPHDTYALHEAYEAVEAVNLSGGNDAAVPLAGLLKDNIEATRITTVHALGKLHADPNLVVPALFEAFAEKDLRYVVTVTLGELVAIDRRIVPTLILALRNENPQIRHAAASALLTIGPAAGAAVPALIVALDDEPLRFEVLLALKKMGSKAKAAARA